MPGADHHARQHLGERSERERLDPFVVATGDASPRDQRDLMERPFFSLAKAKRIAPILYESGGQRVEVFGMPELDSGTLQAAGSPPRFAIARCRPRQPARTRPEIRS